MFEDASTFIEYGTEMIVIREIFDGAHELFENELERAFDVGCSTIVIEPCRLGDETARWIFFGDCLSNFSLVTGLSSIMSGVLLPNHSACQYSLLASSLLAGGIHLLSWQSDICSYYRVEKDPEKFLKIMACTKKFKDNISLITSTEFLSPKDDQSEIEDDRTEDEAYTTTIGDIHQRPVNNLYETIMSQAHLKNKRPVVLCRKSSQDLRRANLINAAVSLLTIAFSMIKFFTTNKTFYSLIKFPMV